MTPEVPVERDRSNDGVSVQLHVVGEVMRKPPLVELQVDVIILNHASEPRWVLLPRQAGHKPAADGGVDTLEVEQWGRLRVGSWLGTGGFRAVRIGADARVQLDKMPVQWWRHDDDPQPDLEVVAVKVLRIDGKPAESYFERVPVSSGNAGGSGGGGSSVIATVRHRPDHAEVTVELVDDVRVSMIPWPRD